MPNVYIESVSTPTVHVVSTDNFDYDAIAGDTYAYTLQIYGDCMTNNRDVLFAEGNTPTNPPPPYAVIDTSDLVHPTRWLTSHFGRQPDTKLPITWPLKMRQRVVAACNANLQSKLLGGVPRAAVLAQTWKLGKVYVGDMPMTLWCREYHEDGSHSDWGSSGGRQAFAYVNCDPRLPDDIVHPVPDEHTGDDPDVRAR